MSRTARSGRSATGEKMLGARSAPPAVRPEVAETVPKAGALCAQWKRCGSAGCRCARGELHGPYWYVFWRERGHLRKRYVRLADVEAVGAELRGRQEFRWLTRLATKEWRRLWREQTASLREYSKWLKP